MILFCLPSNLFSLKHLDFIKLFIRVAFYILIIYFISAFELSIYNSHGSARIMIFPPNLARIIYVLSNLLVIPASLIPNFDFCSNIAFLIAVLLLQKSNLLLSLFICMIFVFKNNANYRFCILLKQKGIELSKSDSECVYFYAWCTLLRYFLIGIAFNQILLFLR